MKNKILKTLAKTVPFFISASLLAGCGAGNVSADRTVSSSSSTVSTSSSPSGTDAETQVKTIIVGTGGSPAPWLWVDENGRVSGYDAEVIYAIDELLPEYELKFEVTEFASLFTGVDTGRYTMAVNNFNWRADRAEKYLFGEEYVCYEKEAIFVRKDYGEITGLSDIGGHRAFTTGNGLMTQLFLEQYNEENPDNPVELVYTDADTLKQFQDIKAGVADFGFLSRPSLANYLEIYPTFYDDFDIIELSDEESEKVCSPFTYFIYSKTPEGEALKAAIDEALRILKSDGTIKELSEKYIGYDVTGR